MVGGRRWVGGSVEQWNEHWLPFELEAFLRKRREKEGKGEGDKTNTESSLHHKHSIKQDVLFVL